MKRALLWLLAALVLGAVAGQLMLDDPGYALLSWHDWVLTTSLWVAVIGVLVLFFAVLLSLGLLNSLLGAIGWWRRGRAEKRGEQSRQLMLTGLTQYAEADWRKATSTLLKAAELVDTPLLVRLASARAAEEDGRHELAEQILRETRIGAGATAPLVDLEIAALKLRHGDAAGARILLERLRERFPKHPRALLLLIDACTQQESWQSLANLLPAAKQQMHSADWIALARRGWQGLLQATANEAGYPGRKARIDALTGRWKSAPAEIRGDESMLAGYVALLLRHEAVAEAQAALEKALGAIASGQLPDDRLLDLYGRLDADKPAEQLALAEKWLQMRPTHPALLLATARISLRNRLWGKARDYFEASAARDANIEVCAELVRLYSRLGENVKAEQYLRRHAELTGVDLPRLPLPTARG